MRATQILATGGIFATLFFAAPQRALAQNPNPQGGEDPLARFLFPPELVMSHQQAIGLSEQQRNTIQQQLQQAQAKFTSLQWRMSANAEKLMNLLQASPVDEARALAQVDEVLNTERDVKKTQISLLIRIKNTLTPEQQAKLSEMRRQLGPQRGPGMPGNPPD